MHKHTQFQAPHFNKKWNMPQNLRRLYETSSRLKHWSSNLHHSSWMLFCECANVSNEQVNMSKCFWNILLIFTKYLENIIWHVWHNIWWCGRIFCHVFMDEKYVWMKMWMKIENGLIFSWTLAMIFFAKKLNKINRMEKIYDGLFWKIRHMKY